MPPHEAANSGKSKSERSEQGPTSPRPGAYPIRQNPEITQLRRAKAGGCRLFLERAACHGTRFPRKGRDAFPASFGIGRRHSERRRRSLPETTGRSPPPAGEPAASPSPLPVSPCVPRLGSPVILLSNFAVCGIVFSVRRRWARPIQDTFLVMSASLSRLMSRIDPPVRQQLDLSGNFRPDGGRKLLAPLHLLD